MLIARGERWDAGHLACLPLAVETQWDHSQAKKGALPGLSLPLETFLHKGMHCESFARLGEDAYGIETIWDLRKRWMPGAGQCY